MRKIITLLSTLALGAGSLKAGLSASDFATFKAWAEKHGYTYMKVFEIQGVAVLAFDNAMMRNIAFVPIDVETLEEARLAFIASSLTFDKLTEKEQHSTAEKSEPEVRRAVPVAAK